MFLNTNKTLSITAGVLAIGIIVSVAVYFSPKSKKTNSNEIVSDTNFTPITTSEYPIPPGNPSVSQTLIHYFINGKITGLEQENSVIVLDNSSLPKFSVGPETRISRLTPPYGSQTSVVVSKNDLKKDLNIIVSAEFDIKSKEWIVRDVYIPTDKN